MDTQKLLSAAPEICFDLLCEWQSQALCCEIDRTHPEASPWQAIVTAIKRGRNFKDSLFGAPPNTSGAKEVTERGLRAALVEAYGSLAAKDLKEVLEAKQQDPWSFFYAYRDLTSAIKHWQWYLLCLSYEEDAFERCGGIDEGVVKMPMDTVDLRAIATIFKTQITVSRFLEEPLRFCPNSEIPEETWSTCHLLGHDGFWAPVLRSKPSSEEELDLTNKIVKLQSLAPAIENVANCRSAMITRYDEDRELYIAKVEDVVFPVERAQICQVLDFQGPRVADELEDRYGLNVAPRADEAPPIHGMPDGCLEFQLLRAMVVEQVKKRLLDTRATLAGRAKCSQPNDYFRYFLRGSDFDSLAYTKIQVYNVSADVAPRARRLQIDQAEREAAEARAPHGDPDLSMKGSMFYAQLDRSMLEQQLPKGPNGSCGSGSNEAAWQVAGCSTAASSSSATPAPTSGLVFSTTTGPGPSGFIREMPLERAKELFGSRRVLAAFVVTEGRSAPIAAETGSDSSISIPIQPGWVVNLSEFSAGFFLGSLVQQPIMGALGPLRQAWFPAKCFLRWEAVKDFNPDPSWRISSKMMPLKTGDQVLVKRHLAQDWDGWVVGVSHKDESMAGIFPESAVKPFLVLSG